MASKSGKLTKAEIASLLQAAHHEPRSLLGYHEFARTDGQPLAMVRVVRTGRRIGGRVLGRDAAEAAH
jgi:hypothetical protein